jgi:hypothetical protein
MDNSNRPSSNTLRQRRYRDNNRNVGMPTDRQFDRALREVVFDHMQQRGDPASEFVSKARDRLLQRFPIEGIAAFIVRKTNSE